jgi:predicted nucleic acid-binding protein
LGAPLITLDTSALVALLDRRDPQHREVRSALEADAGPYLIPAWILAEIAYFADVRMSSSAAGALLEDIETGAYTVECGDGDVPRIRELVARYADLPLGMADAAVIACAERNGGRVLTLDLRDFGVVAKEGKITVLPG